MTDMCHVQSATEMHTALQKMLDVATLLETPKGLNIGLMPHQKRALDWMVRRENQTAPGGILADDMGLGKTLTAISLILHQKNERMKREEEGTDGDDKKWCKMAKEKGLNPSHTTLVVVPASIIRQWEKAIENNVDTDLLCVHVFHTYGRIKPNLLAKCDVVITTYKFLSDDFLAKVAFERIILDEAHEIKTRTTVALNWSPKSTGA